MSSYTEISPNEPDVMPDYVDDKPPPRSSAKKPAPEKKPAATPTAVSAIETAVEPEPQIQPETPPPLSETATADSEQATHREGECVPNVPDIAPAFISAEEEARLAAPEPADDAAAFAPPPAAAPRSPWMKWYIAATVLVVAVFGMLVISQAVSALALARTLPVWAQYLLLIPLGFCCLAVLVVGVSLLHSWFRLRAVRQVDMGALEELRNRAKSRQDGVEHFQEARNQLEGYLQRFPLTHVGQANLVAAGVHAEKVESLAKCRHRLVGLSIDSRTWLDDFRGQFQSELDLAAKSRVNAWSLKAAGCVIASPLPLLDSVLVLGISLKMLKDLCTIYNVRATKTGCLVLLNRAVVAAFIAGVAEDATEVAGGMAAEELSQALGESTVNSLGARMAGVVAPKLGEGAINAFFIRRLGRAAIRMLQPLRPKPGKK